MPPRKIPQRTVWVQPHGPHISSPVNYLSIIGAAIGVLIILGLIFMATQNNNEGFVLPIPNLTAPATQDFSCFDDDCFLEAARKSGSLEACDKILGEDKKQACHAIFAGGNLEACRLLSDSPSKTSCLEKHALRERDISICNEIKAEKDKEWCVSRIEPCYYKPKGEIGLCNAVSKGNYSYCYGDENCLLSYAKEKIDESACGSLSDVVVQVFCRSAVGKNDACGTLPQSKADACRVLYAQESKDFSLCAKISPGTVYELQCYSYYAVDATDAGICEKVDLLNRWDCYRNYSLVRANVSACGLMSQFATLSKTRCYLDFSHMYGKPDVCEALNNFTSVSAKEECYKTGIINNTALSLGSCRGVLSESWKTRCYTNVAGLINSTAACNELERQSDRDFCVSNARKS